MPRQGGPGYFSGGSTFHLTATSGHFDLMSTCMCSEKANKQRKVNNCGFWQKFFSLPGVQILLQNDPKRIITNGPFTAPPCGLLMVFS